MNPSSSETIFVGNSEVARLMRSHDWSQTPLGSVSKWPQSLKTTVRIVLTSRQPMFIGWGDSLLNLYNDAYAAFLGTKHPVLAQPTSQVWPEIWDQLEPRLESVRCTHEGTFDEALLFITERKGYSEETYVTLSCSPILNDEGTLGGILCACTDDTHRTVGERQWVLLRELAVKASDARTLDEACTLSAGCLETNFPFALIYRVDSDRQCAVLAGTSGLEQEHEIAPESIAFENDSIWPLAEVIESQQIRLVSDLADRFEKLPKGAWERSPHQAVVVPLAPLGRMEKASILVLGLNPFRRFDDSYQGFIELVSAQISAGIAIDLTERKRAEVALRRSEGRQAFLLKLNDTLRPLLDAEEIQYQAACVLGEHLGANRVGYAEDQADGETIVVMRNYTNGVPGVEGRYRYDNYGTGLLRQFQAGCLVTYSDVANDPTLTQAEKAAYAARQVGATISVPLVKANRLVAVLFVQYQVAHDWLPEEVTMIQDVAERTWAAVERARAEAALQQSEERYRTLFESIDEGFCIIEMLFDENNTAVDYRFLEVNPVFAQQTELQQAVGKTARQLVPDLEDFWIQTYGRVALTGEPIRFENPSAPMHRWFDVYACRTGEPEARRVAIVFRDISDRKAAEEILRQAADLSAFRVSLADALRLLGDPIEVQATASRLLGEYLGVNRVAYFEVSDTDYVVKQDYVNGATALIGKYPIDSFGSELLTAYQAGCPLCVPDVSANPRLTTDQRSAYAAIQIGAHISVPLVKQGNLVAGMAVHTIEPRAWTPDEVTLVQEVAERIWSALERAQIEADLRRSEAEFRIISNAAPAMVWVGAQDGSIIFFNDRWYEFTGQTETETEAMDSGWAKATHPDDVGRILPHWQYCLQTGEPYEGEVRYRRHDGEYCWYAFRALPRRNASGEIEAWYGLSLDINERKQAEVEREQLLAYEQAAREAAEAANRIKDEFLAVVSHELRSPLSPILGWSKLLRSRLLDAEKTDQALKAIERNAQMQAQLVNDLLDVSSLLRGKLSLDTKPIDLVTILQAALETVQFTAAAKSIQIHTHFEPEVGQVAGDAGRLQQVIWNLLNNAVKFTSKGGRVEVRLEQVIGEENGERNAGITPPESSFAYAQVTVTDTGKGIPANFLPHVFEQFRQESSATTRRFGGLGLGLAIVRYLVEQHGGTIQVESPGEGQGATFTVKLPLVPHPATTQLDTELSERSLNLQGTRILVVDDEEDTRELLAILLELHGANVIVTATASEALARLTQFQPEVLLSDIGMPDIDGYMLMQQVRALPPEQGGTIPAIALTAYAGEIDYKKAVAVGFQQHMAKPIEPEILIQAIASLLNRSIAT